MADFGGNMQVSMDIHMNITVPANLYITFVASSGTTTRAKAIIYD